MNLRKFSFLKGVVGQDGATALIKAAERSELLGGVLVPRAIVAWLNTTFEKGHEGELPGIEGSYFAFQKSEGGYDGAVEIGGDIVTFEGCTLSSVAAHVAVAIGVDKNPWSSKLPAVDLGRLGKSIDVLAKAQSALPKWTVIHDHPTEARTVYAFQNEKGETPQGHTFGPSNPLAKAVIHDDPATPKEIYRVQSAKGDGPYSFRVNEAYAAAGYKEPLDLLHGRMDYDQPGPGGWMGRGDFDYGEWDDLPEREKHKFGFEKPEDATKWFHPEVIKKMEKAGFHLTAIPAKKIIKSNSGKQVIYLPHDSFDPKTVKRFKYDDGTQSFVPHPVSAHEQYRERAAERASAPKLVLTPTEEGTVKAETPLAFSAKKMVKADAGAEKPGPAHAPTKQGEPSKAKAPQGVQPAQPKPPTPQPTQAKLNPVPPLKTTKLPGLSIKKSESSRSCPVCAKPQFQSDRFVGCFCFKELAKSVSVTVTPSGYTLGFSSEWDRAAVMTLAQIMAAQR